MSPASTHPESTPQTCSSITWSHACAVELDTARTKRKELEAEFARTKAALERQLTEALAENEVLEGEREGERGRDVH